MVQLFDIQPTPNVGANLGHALGQGIQGGLNKSLNVQYERGLLQNALQKARSQVNNPNATPLDTMFALMEAGAGIPGSEKYLATLLPQIVQQQRINDIANRRGGQGQQPANIAAPAQMQGNVNMNPQMANQVPLQQGLNANNAIPNANIAAPNANPSQAFQQNGLNAAGQPNLGNATGIYPNLMSPEQITQEAINLAAQSGDLSTVPTWQDVLTKQNAAAVAQANEQVLSQQRETQRQEDILKRDEQLRDFAQKQLKIGGNAASQEELNDFMLIGQKNSNLPPAQWYEKTRIDFDQYMREKTQFDKMFVPGALRGIFLGGNERERELSRIEPNVQKFIGYGKESYVRNKLADLGLTQTEVEKLVHPLDKAIRKGIDALPQGKFALPKNLYLSEFKKTPEVNIPTEKENAKFANQVAEFLKDNLGNNSLLAVRDPFINIKHYTWEQFWEGLQAAQSQGLKLNQSQQAELEELRNPPRDSVANIFRGAANFIDYLRGSR